MDRICLIAMVLALLLSLLIVGQGTAAPEERGRTMGYEDTLFDGTKVHTIDIVMDGWEEFLETAQEEEYASCSVVIDGKAVRGVGIRAKGNTSLSSVAAMGSSRYSFKIEFDHYDAGKTYRGLDKLSLNNLIQDNTMMKDFLTYRMMDAFGVDAPLCSYAYLTVNGADWGLYLAVEGVEESFLERNYGSGYGELYKPDSTAMGGGRGNGKDFEFPDAPNGNDPSAPAGEESSSGGGSGAAPGDASAPTDTAPAGEGSSSGGGNAAAPTDAPAPTGETPAGGAEESSSGGAGTPQNGDARQPEEGADVPQGGFPGGFGMGDGETSLVYTDDDPDSYATIFSSAKTDLTKADKVRLIAAIKELNEGNTDAVDVDEVLRYFVVHNFVVNGDSYTGSIVHNYYLYEENGKLSMIPWDYNLAFGTFQGNLADTAVNDPIDAPLSIGTQDRPIIDWIFASEEYTSLYHRYFREFLDSVDPLAMIEEAKALIAPYVEKDPTKFCTYPEFEKGVETISAFCRLRRESVEAQLSGETGNVGASSITLSDMGTMGGFGTPGGDPEASGWGCPQEGAAGDDRTQSETPDTGTFPAAPGNGPSSAPETDAAVSASREKGNAGYVLAALSLLILTAGILFAKYYKR